MQDYDLVNRKFETFLKINQKDNLMESRVTTPPEGNISNGMKYLKEVSLDNVVQYDETNRLYTHVSGVEKRKKYRSNSLQNMWESELIVNPNSDKQQPEKTGNCFLMDICQISKTTCCKKHWRSNLCDILLRILAVFLFFKLETSTAFKRKIHMEELWLYQNPMMPDIVTPTELLLAVILIPWGVSLIVYCITKNRRDYEAACWTWTLGLCVNGLLTSMLKISFGRPRPDFFYRCFPDGIMVLNNVTDPTGHADLFNCTGNLRVINEGRKSFPSGHASFAFTSFSFITFYLGTKLHAFDSRGRGQTWRLVFSTLPLVVACLIAISRTCDYHHHWQDVLFGGIIGLLTSYLCYRQYYPSIFDTNSHLPLKRFQNNQCQLEHQECKKTPKTKKIDE